MRPYPIFPILLIILFLTPVPQSGIVLAEEPDDPGFEMAESSLSRNMSPDVSPADMEELVMGNTEFAFDLYHALRDDTENLFYSPYSISVALAMTYAGARGDTETQMAETMHFTLPQESLHPAFNGLDLGISERSGYVLGSGRDPFRLHVVNSIWGQRDYEFLQDFLDVLAVNYGAGMRLVDYVSDPDGCRITINRWVEDQTEDRIQDLIPPLVINDLTRLVLVNAIYFKAYWVHQFEEEDTRDGEFNLLDGGTITVPMMEQTESFSYAEGDGWQAIELGYDGGGGVSMIIVMPEDGRFEEFEDYLDGGVVERIIDEKSWAEVHLTMPRFEFDCDFSLSRTLSDLGMPDAFTQGVADFSGMDGTDCLYIYEVIHQAFVSVDEEGTEAAAATAVMMAGRGPGYDEIVELRIDHPFIFLIREQPTGTIFFLGRVMNPAM